MPRVHILNSAEQAHQDSPPAFSSAERKRFFDFSHSVMDAAHFLLASCNQARFAGSSHPS